MAGKIIADTLEHSTAGEIATNYVVNGSAKAWVSFNGTGTVAIRDSFGASSISDDSTGDYTVTLTNSMSTTTDWSGAISGNGAGYTHSFGGTSSAFTANTFPVNVRVAASSDADVSLLCGQVFGDLA